MSSNSENNNKESKEEKESASITIDIKKKKIDDELLEIPNTPLKLGKLSYSASEVANRIKKGEYKLIIEFTSPVSILIDIKNNENGYLPSCSYNRSGIKKFEFEYINVSFTIILEVSKETLNGKGNKNRSIKLDEYSASMESCKSIFYQVNICDYTSLIVEKMECPRFDNETIQYLKEDIVKQHNKKEDKKEDKEENKKKYEIGSKDHQFIFCAINNNVIGKIFPEETKINENTEFAFFYSKIVYPLETEKKDKIANIRCLISTSENDYPYVLSVCSNAQVVQIFKNVREIISNCKIYKSKVIEFLCIKLCFMNYQIRLNESDETSTFYDIARTLLYTFSNFEDCEDLYLKVDLILSK